MQPLAVTAFIDGRPGHEKQTRGVLAAMAAETPVDVTFHTVKPGSFFRGFLDWARYFGRYLFPVKTIVKSKSIDLIIGTGSHTHVPMLALKKMSGAKVVTCMSPSFPFIRLMDLCFVPEHDEKEPAENIFATIGPPNTSESKGWHCPEKGLILVGGIDEKSHRWSTSRVLDQIHTILKKDTGTTWTLSSSPRTPEETHLALERLAGENKKILFFRPESTPPGWIEKQYDKSGSVWVTADSISMVFEALTAGCRVGILPVEWKGKDNKFNRSADFLISNGWVTSFEKWKINMEITAPEANLDEAARCAREILNRWWPNRLLSYNCSRS
jgi:uncharacterized protein